MVTDEPVKIDRRICGHLFFTIWDSDPSIFTNYFQTIYSAKFIVEMNLSKKLMEEIWK